MDDRIIGKKLQLLQGMATESATPVTGWRGRLAAHPAIGTYHYEGDWKPLTLPAAFPAGKTVFLQADCNVPAKTPLADSYLVVNFQDMEGLLSLDGDAYAGIDWAHGRAALRRTGKLKLQLEFMSVPWVYHAPEQAGRSGTFTGVSLTTVSRLVESFCLDLRFAWDTARVVTEPRRKALLEAAVEAAMLAVDVSLPRPRLLAEIKQAQHILKQKLADIAPDPEAGSIYAVGHTHIDTAWLWPLRETVRKCGRTFSTACRLMERYPDFHFACSQPQLYQYTKEHYPEVFRQIRKWVTAGRWETAGAMWVEADCNVTSGESLVRQILYGLDFFRREFGTRPRLCWLPDVFGYPSSLPEILAGCGIRYFYTYKLHWQAKNSFPVHLFRWRGLDGSEVVAHVVNHVGAYNNSVCPDHLYKGWQLYAQKAEYPEVIFPYGFGDGGGGATEEMLDMLQRAKGHYPGLPAVRTGTAEAFFDDVVRSRQPLPLWDGELYVETHRGTYTTQSAMKRANRVSERLLRDAEVFGCFAALSGQAFDTKVLRQAWELTLLHQFHDILPGSSIGMVYQDSMADHARVQETAKTSAAASLQALAPAAGRGAANSVMVCNSLGWARADVVTAELPGNAVPASVVAPDGTRRSVQVVGRHGKNSTVVFDAAGVPAAGLALFAYSAEAAADPAPLRATATALENAFFRVSLNQAGAITRLYDKRHARDVVPHGALANDLQLLQDGPEGEDAWNVHETNDKRHYPFEGKTTIAVVESGPVRAVLRVKRTHRESTLEQDIILYANLPRLDFVTRVDWQERHTMLKVAFPLAIRSTRAAYEVQFGAYERPTHRNTSWDQQKFEVPGHRWADLSESGYGVSLLNDCRYGYDAKENVLRLTLLRSTIFPDPQADRGRHEFTYSLLPHAGSWQDGETVRHAAELNVPAAALPVHAPAETPALRCFVELSGAAAVLETVKPAEDGKGLILRVYEPHGARGTVSAKLDFAVTSVQPCNLVEEDAGKPLPLRDGGFAFDLLPFQIRTFRLGLG